MAWNPTPEVAAVRDAANKLKSPFAVIVFLTEDGRILTASYGKTRELCAHAANLAEHLHEAAANWD